MMHLRSLMSESNTIRKALLDLIMQAANLEEIYTGISDIRMSRYVQMTRLRNKFRLL